MPGAWCLPFVNAPSPLGVNPDVSSTYPRFSYSTAAFGLAILIALPTAGTALQSAAQNGQATRPPATGQAQTQAPAPATQTSNSRPGPLWEWEWWKDADVQKELSLTDAKVKNISRIFEDRVRRSQALAETYEKERAELNRVTEERQVSVDAYQIIVTRVEALRTELNKGRLVMLYRMYRELTPEQVKKFNEIRERRMNAMRNGRGGRGGSQPHR